MDGRVIERCICLAMIRSNEYTKLKTNESRQTTPILALDPQSGFLSFLLSSELSTLHAFPGPHKRTHRFCNLLKALPPAHSFSHLPSLYLSSLSTILKRTLPFLHSSGYLYRLAYQGIRRARPSPAKPSPLGRRKSGVEG